MLLHGKGAALACGQEGELEPGKCHGLFAGDTRVLSTYHFKANGRSWHLLGRTRRGRATVEWAFQNPTLQRARRKIPQGTLFFGLRRRLEGALHDDLTIRNYGRKAAHIRLALEVDSDFSDIFEVKGHSPLVRRKIKRQNNRRGLCLSYQRKEFRRALHLAFTPSSSKPKYAGSSVSFDLVLEPGGEWTCCVEAAPEIEEQVIHFAGDPHLEEADAEEDRCRVSLRTDWLLQAPFRRAIDDLHALAIPFKNGSAYLAAGAPWFMTLFGRDSLMAALMSGLDGPWAVEGALIALSEHQAEERDDWRDAEPGKFPHEIRRGELARFRKIPHAAYYGSHDAPALYCLALWQAWRWTGRRELLDAHFEAAKRALAWCERLGDRDGDGLLEYETRSPQGYYNQSWKDSGDAIVDINGALAKPPLATVELQGYFYAARLAMAELHEERGDPAEAKRLRQNAAELRKLVEDRYWLEDEGFYALALDGAKRRLNTISSNPSHLLWCGLCSPERACRVAERLLCPDMYTRWGIRTLSSRNPAYNPLSYQRGSVWPHDSTLAASGLWRYGLFDAADRLLEAVLNAANAFEQYRLPEVFCGFDRDDQFPIPYEMANFPQAWSSAVPVLCAQLFLGIVPDAPRGRCFLSPRLPSYLPKLELRRVPVGEGTLDIVLHSDAGHTAIEALDAYGIEVVVENVPAPLWGMPYSFGTMLTCPFRSNVAI
jgi:glycogen debranching enzyme